VWDAAIKGNEGVTKHIKGTETPTWEPGTRSEIKSISEKREVKRKKFAKGEQRGVLKIGIGNGGKTGQEQIKKGGSQIGRG